MLDKNEQRYFGGQDVASVVQQIQGVLYQGGIVMQQTSPNTWGGTGRQESYGMTPRVMLSTMPVQNGFCVDVRVGAELQTNAIIVLVVAWLVFFPVAVILAALGYSDWQNRQTQLLLAIWRPVQNRMIAPQFGVPAQPGFAPPPGGAGGGQA